jgi:hypothetical protein
VASNIPLILDDDDDGILNLFIDNKLTFPNISQKNKNVCSGGSD